MFGPLKVLSELHCLEGTMRLRADLKSFPCTFKLGDFQNPNLIGSLVQQEDYSKSLRVKPWGQLAWIQILALPPTGCVTLGKFFDISVLSYITAKPGMTAMVSDS